MQDRQDEKDYVIAPKRSRYDATRVRILFDVWLKERAADFFQQDAFNDLGWLLHNIKNQKKIALFKTTILPDSSKAFCPDSLTNPHLDAVLQCYSDENSVCDKLIIPLVNISRGHFRLLVIEPNDKKATYYDSKLKVMTVLSELFSSAVSAYHGTENKGDISETIQRVFAGFYSHYYYVQSTCERYFPGIYFKEISLGQQGYNNDIDCGLCTVAYAFNELTDKSSLNLDLDETWLDHNELMNRYLDSCHAEHKPQEKTKEQEKEKVAETLTESVLNKHYHRKRHHLLFKPKIAEQYRIKNRNHDKNHNAHRRYSPP